MSRKPSFGRRVMFNTALVVVLLAVLNLLASVILDGRRIYRSLVLPSDERAGLPNYPDKQWARQVLGEFNQLETRYVPFVEWRRAEYHGKAVTVRPDGDRAMMPASTQAPVGTVRFFGGSAMWGTGVEDDQTIPAFFNRLEPDFRVVNHGESGFSTRQDLAQLVNLVNQNEPMDLVVSYDGNNDAVNYCRTDVEINGHVHARKIERLLKPTSWIWNDLAGPLQELLSGKALRRLLSDPGPYATRCHQSAEYAQRVAETMVNNWKIARAVARQGGADFIAILQPVASLGSARVDHLSPEDSSPRNEQALVYPIIQRLLAESGADWAYDFTDIFDGDEYTYIDVCHVTANGNRRVAERIDQILGPRLRALVARSRN
ncbi:MAG: hypothetical protein HY899_06085 [Deltaproteobacteria bacterium]|nr:hypothetical protein [Deltaproteobacteria bacterium]